MCKDQIEKNKLSNQKKLRRKKKETLNFKILFFFNF